MTNNDMGKTVPHQASNVSNTSDVSHIDNEYSQTWSRLCRRALRDLQAKGSLYFATELCALQINFVYTNGHEIREDYAHSVLKEFSKLGEKEKCRSRSRSESPGWRVEK